LLTNRQTNNDENITFLGRGNSTGTKWLKNAQKSKPKSKENLNQQSTLTTAHVCVCITRDVKIEFFG